MSHLLPIKVLAGPRQAGKTSLLTRIPGYRPVFLDDPAIRSAVQSDPRAFLDQQPHQLILDEAALAPALFPELKRRVDEQRRKERVELDYWLTGSNQTLMRKNVSESLAGRASFFDLNTLSIHELKELTLVEQCMKGGWPELRADNKLDSVRYLNDLITSFIERDIAAGAGIEKLGAFQTVLQLNAGRIGQLYVSTEVAKLASVDTTTVQAWNRLLQLNGLIELIRPFYSNLNKRLIKTPKLYFQDVSFATRLQGWSEFPPLFVSPHMGGVFENLVFTELNRSFLNRGEQPKIFYLRSKEQVEIDFLIELPNQRYLAVEAKLTAQDFSEKQLKLLESLDIQVVDRWIVSYRSDIPFKNAVNVALDEVWSKIGELI